MALKRFACSQNLKVSCWIPCILQKVLLVTDSFLAGSGILDDMKRVLKEQDVSYVVYDGVLPDPAFDQVREGVAQAQAQHQRGGRWRPVGHAFGDDTELVEIREHQRDQRRSPQRAAVVQAGRPPSGLASGAPPGSCSAGEGSTATATFHVNGTLDCSECVQVRETDSSSRMPVLVEASEDSSSFLS